MIKKMLLVFLSITTFQIISMEKKFELQDIIALAAQRPTHQPFIETHFALLLPSLQPDRDQRLEKLKSEINESKGANDTLERVHAHLMIAYFMAEARDHTKTSKQLTYIIKAEELISQLKKNKLYSPPTIL